jgi:hypothetical protein
MGYSLDLFRKQAANATYHTVPPTTSPLMTNEPSINVRDGISSCPSRYATAEHLALT